MQYSIRRVVIAIAAMILLAVAVPAAPADAQPMPDTVSGYVTDGLGNALAGVEVYISDDLVGPRYTCTDAAGWYSFDNVVTFSEIAAGPAVAPMYGCANRKFYTSAGVPLVAVFGTPGTAPATVDMMASEIPDNVRRLVGLARRATNACYNGNFARFDRLATRYDTVLARRAPGLPSRVGLLYADVAANHFDFWQVIGCRPDATTPVT